MPGDQLLQGGCVESGWLQSSFKGIIGGDQYGEWDPLKIVTEAAVICTCDVIGARERGGGGRGGQSQVDSSSGFREQCTICMHALFWQTGWLRKGR
jgi:hypothetical protein